MLNTKIQRSINEPIRKGLTWDETWKKADKGIIVSWEIGRKLSLDEPDLAKKAKNGELPILGWKGGVEKTIKKKLKYGTFFYLAQWQGLRGEDLDIDLSKETELVCSKTGIKVIFTDDSKKYLNG